MLIGSETACEQALPLGDIVKSTYASGTREEIRERAISFIQSFSHFILPLTRNTTTVYRNTLKIIYNIPTKLFTRLNVVKARKPI